MADVSDDDSDDWGAADLDLSGVAATTAGNSSAGPSQQQPQQQDGEDYWKVEKKVIEQNATDNSITIEDSKKGEGEPMILVDLTQLTDDRIHSRFDRNSVNDPEAVSTWRKAIQYEEYSKKPDLLANGTVIPCGSSVWRAALMRLRDERKGHYFVPIFP